jgi:hypothetical protein
VDPLNDTVCSLDGTMSLSEAKLMSGDETVGGDQLEDMV